MIDRGPEWQGTIRIPPGPTLTQTIQPSRDADQSAQRRDSRRRAWHPLCRGLSTSCPMTSLLSNGLSPGLRRMHPQTETRTRRRAACTCGRIAHRCATSGNRGGCARHAPRNANTVQPHGVLMTKQRLEPYVNYSGLGTTDSARGLSSCFYYISVMDWAEILPQLGSFLNQIVDA